MTHADRLYQTERELAKVSAMQHRLAKKKLRLQRETLELRTSMTNQDAHDYETLLWAKTNAEALR